MDASLEITVLTNAHVQYTCAFINTVITKYASIMHIVHHADGFISCFPFAKSALDFETQFEDAFHKPTMILANSENKEISC